MSVAVMTWVFQHSEATGNDRLVLLAIADRANDDGDDCWPSIPTIARKARCSDRTVQRSIKALVQLGELAVDEGSGPYGANRYRVLMRPPGGDNLTPPPGDNLSPRQPVTGDTGDTGVVTLLSPNTSLRPITPQPPARGGRNHCDRHTRHRRTCDDCVAAAAAAKAKPPWCGSCDERTRLVDTATGVIRCRRCHPLTQPDRVNPEGTPS